MKLLTHGEIDHDQKTFTVFPLISAAPQMSAVFW